MSGTFRRSQIIDEVKAAVCRDRQNAYSDAENNFKDIADYWTLWARGRGLLKDNAAFSPIDVAQMSAFIKVARAQANPLYADNWVDQAGYAVCGGGIAASEREKANNQQAPTTTFQPGIPPWAVVEGEGSTVQANPGNGPETGGPGHRHLSPGGGANGAPCHRQDH